MNKHHCLTTVLLLLLMLTSFNIQAQCPEIIRGPYLQPGSDGQATNSVTIYWQTDDQESNLLIGYKIAGSSNNFSYAAVNSGTQKKYIIPSRCEEDSGDWDGNEKIDRAVYYDQEDIVTVYNYKKTFTFPSNNEYEYHIKKSGGCILTDNLGNEISGTIKNPDAGLDIWILGDSGSESGLKNTRDAHQAFLASSDSPSDDFDFLLLLGDNAYGEYKVDHTSNANYCTDVGSADYYCIDCDSDGGEYAHQEEFFNPLSTILKDKVSWPAIGNHEVYTLNNASHTLQNNINDFQDIFPFIPEESGYYSFDYGDVHFVCLNAEIDHTSLGSDLFSEDMNDMADWLETDLQQNVDAAWTIVYFHHPVHSGGKPGRNTLLSSVEDDIKEMINNIAPLLDEYDVDLVLSGHNHFYERSFLVDGHYNNVNESYTVGDISYDSFDENNSDMLLDTGCGNCLSGYNPNDVAYDEFDANFTKTDKGTVYVVVGSSGKADNGSVSSYPDPFFNHPMMRPFPIPIPENEDDMNPNHNGRGIFEKGSLHLSIEGNTLNAQFIAQEEDDEGYRILDEFTITKTSVAPNGQPDLVVEDINGNSTATVGSNYTVSFDVTNQGAAPTSETGNNSGYSYVKYYLSDDTTKDNSDDGLGNANSLTSKLDPNESQTITKTLSLPSNVTGNKYLLIYADKDGNVGESDETNNIGIIAINITDGTSSSCEAPTANEIKRKYYGNHTILKVYATHAVGESRVFQYREVGDTEWIDVTNPYTTSSGLQSGGLLTNLSSCTDYEVQIGKICDNGETLYSSGLKVYKSREEAPGTESLSVDTYCGWARLYCQHYTGQQIRVRYRQVDNSAWTTTGYVNSHFVVVNNLQPGVNYEYQALVRCSGSTLSSTWSTPFPFSTPSCKSSDDSFLAKEPVELKVYPNPTTDFVNIEMSGENITGPILIYDVQGRLVKQITLEGENPGLIQADISDLINGVYIINVGGGQLIERITKF